MNNMEAAIPEDLLANVLGRLPPCSLAVSRCVRKDWRALIDNRRLLRADLLPLRLDAFFFKGQILTSHPYFFSSRSTARRIGGRLDFLDTFNDEDLQIMDHCNGLLLFFERLANPATRQWMHLPTFPMSPCVTLGLRTGFCLVYDPMVSPHHFEVFCVPLVPENIFYRSSDNLDPDSNSSVDQESLEWPLSSRCTTHVFSSRKWRWEERSFVRQQGVEPANETIADLQFHPQQFQRRALYLKGEIYVQCKNNSLMRITLSNDKYQMIKSPVESKIDDGNGVLQLGKSEKGVYFVLLMKDNNFPQFQVWLLNKSSSCGGQVEWALKTNISLEAIMDNFPLNTDNSFSRPWILNYVTEEAIRRAQEEEEELEWDFENGIILETKDKAEAHHLNNIYFIGFHPYKEIAFFWVSSSRMISYHLNTSKVQELGILFHLPGIAQSFLYTPCWMELFENNN
uniref:F-box domain-containing protein n=1 Tax=Oryza meridionalis TaxID=40149 RepID=A0A0E0CFM8_9ORYZ